MSPSKFSGVTLRTGDQVKILMPGGGGYGDPARRDRDAVRRDVEEGFVSEEAARDASTGSRRTDRWASGSAGEISYLKANRAACDALRASDRDPLLGRRGRTASSGRSARRSTSGSTTTTGSPATEREEVD